MNIVGFILSRNNGALIEKAIKKCPKCINQITHNLNKFPSVTIVDSNEEQIFGVVDYQSANTIVLTFSAAISGKAYLN